MIEQSDTILIHFAVSAYVDIHEQLQLARMLCPIRRQADEYHRDVM